MNRRSGSPPAGVVRLTSADMRAVAGRAATTPLKRDRVCAHPSVADPLHEMLIVLARDTYVRPHRHPGKSESFHVVEGAAELVVFDSGGEIDEVLRLGDYASGRCFYYRMNEPAFHTVLVRSEVLVVHETTNGPFDPDETEFAGWAPDPSAHEACVAYRRALEDRLAAREAVSE